MKLYKKQILSVTILFLFCVFFIATSVADPEKESTKSNEELLIELGKNHFVHYCQPCHVLPLNEMNDNPLRGLFSRLPKPSDPYFIAFVSDSRQLRNNGDKYAISVHKYWNSNYDHKFKGALSSKDLEQLRSYLKHQTQ